MFVALVATLASFSHGQAPLEPADGKVLIGSWYDRPIAKDTPSAINSRLNYKPLSFFQTDFDLSGVVKPLTAPTGSDQFLQQLIDSGTDAAAYLTIYPFEGLNAITDAQLQDLAERIRRLIQSGRGVFIRFAPEMNGSWFIYGQDPALFIQVYRRFVTFIRNALTGLGDKFAFIWGPNSGNGYPYAGQEFSATDPAKIRLLDTNGNGVLDGGDNPYTPYYPGDEYVDWVGVSIYHYGFAWPWVQNQIPEPNKFEGYLQGNVKPEWGTFPFYSYFSGPDGVRDNATGRVISAGNKPFIVPETGSTYHYSWANASTPGLPDPGNNTRVQVKQAWWRQFLTADFVAKYPKFKAVCTFEFVKSEELTNRDFTNFGPISNSVGFEREDNEVLMAFVADMRSSMPFIQYANAIKTGGNAGNNSINGPSTGGAKAVLPTLLTCFVLLLVAEF